MSFDFSVSFSTKAAAVRGETELKHLDICIKNKMAYPGSIQYYMLSAPSEAVFNIFVDKIGARKTGPKALLVK